MATRLPRSSRWARKTTPCLLRRGGGRGGRTGLLKSGIAEETAGEVRDAAVEHGIGAMIFVDHGQQLGFKIGVGGAFVVEEGPLLGAGRSTALLNRAWMRLQRALSMVLLPQGVGKPGFGGAPVAKDGGFGDVEKLGDFRSFRGHRRNGFRPSWPGEARCVRGHRGRYRGEEFAFTGDGGAGFVEGDEAGVRASSLSALRRRAASTSTWRMARAAIRLK